MKRRDELAFENGKIMSIKKLGKEKKEKLTRVTIEISDRQIKQIKNQVNLLKLLNDKYPDTMLSTGDKILLLIHDKIKE
jgi:hypothetical protein